jgi:hypothetical protein
MPGFSGINGYFKSRYWYRNIKYPLIPEKSGRRRGIPREINLNYMYVVVVVLFYVFKRPEGRIGRPILCLGRPRYIEKL